MLSVHAKSPVLLRLPPLKYAKFLRVPATSEKVDHM